MHKFAQNSQKTLNDPQIVYLPKNEMNRALGHLCAHIG